jgi:nucleoside-diphosphate-sugar epimerase
MDILIIGGTRYMGRIVVEKLLDRGDNVTLFSRGNTRPSWWDQITHIAGDRDEREEFSAKLKGKSFDAVLDTQAFRKEDVVSAVEVFRGNIGRYAMVSTGSVYQDGKLDFSTHCPFKESDVEWSALDYTYPEGEDAYGVGKRHCEKWLQENCDIPYTIVRIPAVMGWDDPTGRMWWWVQRALDGKGIVVPAENRAPFRTLYSGDAAANFIRAIDSPAAANQTYHTAMDEVVTTERWADLIWQAAGNTCEVTYVPNEIISNSDLETYAPPLNRSVPYIHDLSKAKSEFGFQTTPITEWIQLTVDWYREHYHGEDSKGYYQRDQENILAKRWQTHLDRSIAGFTTT